MCVGAMRACTSETKTKRLRITAHLRQFFFWVGGGCFFFNPQEIICSPLMRGREPCSHLCHLCVRWAQVCVCVCERQAPLSVPSHMDVGVNGECPTLPPPLFARHIHMHEADVHVYVCARAGEE